MSDEDLICVCMTVTRGEILAAIRRGTVTMDELKASLFCCTGCGTCEPRVRRILEEELGKSSAAAEGHAADGTGTPKTPKGGR